MPAEIIPENDLYVLLNNGMTQSEISRRFNVSRQAVSIRLKYREKSKYPYVKMRQFSVIFLRRLGFLLDEISELTGYTKVHIRILMKRNGLPTKETYYNTFQSKKFSMGIFSILFLFRIGFTIQEIAVMTNYSFYTVRSYLRRMGYSMKGRS